MDYISEAKALFDYTSKMRRDFHEHPELGFEEIRTSAIVAEALTEAGFAVTKNVGKTGVTGILTGTKPKPVAMLRFDMDALPMQEENDVPYASKTAGVMHACGHDSHTAIGLTLAKIFAGHKEEIPGTIKLIFQPAEEGQGGAEAMVADGVLENPVPDFCLGVHVWNDKPVGWIEMTNGPVMAGADSFSIKIDGVGGHGATPHLTVDPIVIAAQLIQTLQTIVSRNVHPLENAVISTTCVESGTAFNIIPPYATLKGTIRTFTKDVRALVLRRMNEVCKGIALANNCEISFDLDEITPPVTNDKVVTEMLSASVQSLYPDYAYDSSFRTMGSEDMAFYMQKVPGCFVMVGSKNEEKGFVFGHHHPRFDIDESALPIAVAMLAKGTIDLLHGWKK